jgi:hypothetical protein
MTTPVFRYGDIKTLMNTIVHKLEGAGYTQEAEAMASLTHIIACRIEPPDVSNRWGVDYILECMEHHQALTEYINNGNPV